MASKYKHVTWLPGRGQWLAQIASKGVYKLFSAEEDAAEYVRKALRKSAKVLRPHVVAQGAHDETKFKYVSWRPIRKRWLTHVPGKLYRHYITKEAAVKAACRSSGVPRLQLQIGLTHGGPGNFKQHNRRAQKRMLFKLLWHVYSHTSRKRRCTTVPGDLSATLRHQTRSAAMFKADPALLVCSLRGKESQWKEALLTCWKKSKPQTALDVFSMLQDAIAELAKPSARATSEVWQKHVNRNVTHHAGWLPLVQTALPLIRKVSVKGSGVKGSGVKGSGVLVLGSTGQLYKPLPFSAKFTRAYEELRKVGEILQTLPRVKSSSEWATAVQQATANAKKAGVGRIVDRRYMWPWLIRLQLLAVMRTGGIKRLSDDGLSVAELSAMAPDMKGHVTDLAEHRAGVKELFETVGYDGPPELFSMYCCIFLSASAGVDVGDIEARLAQLVSAREEFTTKWGIPPHPALLLSGDL